MIEIPINPFLVPVIFLYLLTYLLRHRLFLYATAGRFRHETDGVRGEHVFVVQNLEDVDMSVPFKISVSTTNNAGKIIHAQLFAGKQGLINENFQEDGRERFSMVAVSMPANDTWKIVVTTNDEAERIRLNLHGWDLRRKHSRWWFPTFSYGGIAISSRQSAVQRELTRPAKTVAWLCLLLLMLVYRLVVGYLAHLPARSRLGFPLGPLLDRVRELSSHWDPRVDWTIMAVLVVLGIIGTLMTVRTWSLPIPIGYLGDQYWRGVFDEYDRRVPQAPPDESLIR